MKNWKTTVQPILTGTLSVTTALLATNLIPAKYAAILIGVQALAKAVIGAMQNDAVAPPKAA